MWKHINGSHKIPYRKHDILVHHIINMYQIVVLCLTLCIQYISNLIYSEYKLHANIEFDAS